MSTSEATIESNADESLPFENEFSSGAADRFAAQDASAEAPYSIRTPDDMPLDSATLNRFTPLLRRLSADDASVQGLVDAYVEARREEAGALTQSLESQRQAWFREVQQHPELGGRHFERTQADVRRALHSPFVPPALREAFLSADARSGREQGTLYFLQTYPPLVEFFANVGAQLREARFTTTNRANGSRASESRSDADRARALFDNSPDLFGE